MFIKKFSGSQSAARLAVLLLSLLFAGSAVFASGGDGGGGGGNEKSYKTADVSPEKYEQGKKLFLEQVVCDDCRYANLEQSSDSVAAVWPEMKKDLHKKGVIGSELTRKERRAIKAFMRKRFEL